ncbi:hypothetical protein X961_4138 [Burkholderia pseudomallei MSHR5613]|nr:hypothetical protein DO65_3789 [Burkholderia pseudomallei]KGC53318.1 hypothetical protein DM75_1505 [Burkholderia mallei]KGS47625.1 hypothetical protein X961_4138 [Burkholderia pseudomallei MSHR5613]KGS74555.1 hypothetical protein X976_5179 [Burkholderia pseudomallei MSHR7500]KGS93995.1 hypothetical protein X963_4073 [Burkholderia pseudomallei MSHR7498]KGX55172.1 hypothetical protein Y025_4186 [Burkholderia pseudomallei TSV32]KGX72435.1 hypothetical protein Y026_2048 [Burkholderia pseudoma
MRAAPRQYPVSLRLEAPGRDARAEAVRDARRTVAPLQQRGQHRLAAALGQP